MDSLGGGGTPHLSNNMMIQYVDGRAEHMTDTTRQQRWQSTPPPSYQIILDPSLPSVITGENRSAQRNPACGVWYCRFKRETLFSHATDMTSARLYISKKTMQCRGKCRESGNLVGNVEICRTLQPTTVNHNNTIKIPDFLTKLVSATSARND